MLLLHTSDWHVGKKVRGHSRSDEHRAVLGEIAQTARERSVDLVVVSGDVFETSAPDPEADEIAYDALLQLAEGGRPVLVVTGNHDNAKRFEALAPLLARVGVVVVSQPVAADDGGVFSTSVNGVRVNVAMVPFVSQRGIVRTRHLMEEPAFVHAQRYGERLAVILEHLALAFEPDSVNLVMAHAFVTGGAPGGGERAAHLVETYQVSAQSFPPLANYVALGHLHRSQQVPGPTAIHYCGSPLQMDFGESDQPKVVKVCQLDPGLPAKVTEVPLTAGRALVTVTGTLAEIRESEPPADAWLRVVLDEASRPGLADEVRSVLGERVCDVIARPAVTGHAPARSRTERSPRDLLGEYIETQGVEDQRLITLFDELCDDEAMPSAGDA